MVSRTDSLNDFVASKYAMISKSREVIAYVFEMAVNPAIMIHTIENLSQNVVGLIGFRANHPFSSTFSHGLMPRYLSKSRCIQISKICTIFLPIYFVYLIIPFIKNQVFFNGKLSFFWNFFNSSGGISLN